MLRIINDLLMLDIDASYDGTVDRLERKQHW